MLKIFLKFIFLPLSLASCMNYHKMELYTFVSTKIADTSDENIIILEARGAIYKGIVFEKTDKGITCRMIEKNQRIKERKIKINQIVLKELYKLDSIVSFTECKGSEIVNSHEVLYMLNFKGVISTFNSSCLFDMKETDHVPYSRIQILMDYLNAE